MVLIVKRSRLTGHSAFTHQGEHAMFSLIFRIPSVRRQVQEYISLSLYRMGKVDMVVQELLDALARGERYPNFTISQHTESGVDIFTTLDRSNDGVTTAKLCFTTFGDEYELLMLVAAVAGKYDIKGLGVDGVELRRRMYRMDITAFVEKAGHVLNPANR